MSIGRSCMTPAMVWTGRIRRLDFELGVPRWLREYENAKTRSTLCPLCTKQPYSLSRNNLARTPSRYYQLTLKSSCCTGLECITISISQYASVCMAWPKPSAVVCITMSISQYASIYMTRPKPNAMVYITMSISQYTSIYMARTKPNAMVCFTMSISQYASICMARPKPNAVVWWKSHWERQLCIPALWR